MTERMLAQGVDHLWLDATGLDNFDARFPTIAASVRAIGLDPGRDWLPIAPAAHYLSGGILTDLDGASALPGLWAAGEAACTGVHGANRLASNSLLEGMVFAPRVVEAIVAGKDGPSATGAMRAVLGGGGLPGAPLSITPIDNPAGPPDPSAQDRLQRAMTRGAGVLRSADSLMETAKELAALPAYDPEVRNLLTVAGALLTAALAREESRGNHTRADFPETRDEFRLRMVLR
jgi:L-aspartate oxidase